MFGYFKKYNYEVRERGEVITFVGNYAASRGQAAALVFYVFFGAFPDMKQLKNNAAKLSSFTHASGPCTKVCKPIATAGSNC